MNLKNLIRLDAAAALLSAVIVFPLRPYFSTLFNLPKDLLTGLSLISLAYAMASFFLSQREVIRKRFLTMLIVGNFLYSLLCLILLILFYKTTTQLGVIYFILDIVIVSALAILETRQIKNAPSQ